MDLIIDLKHLKETLRPVSVISMLLAITSQNKDFYLFFNGKFRPYFEYAVLNVKIFW
jgi:hypothetical protein